MADYLLLRGWAREQRHWGGFPKRLQEEIGGSGRVICLDHPGFGTEFSRLSPFSLEEIVEDLRYRWRQLKPSENSYVIGISLGGMIALQWAKQFPKDWRGTVVINSSIAGYSKPWERLFMKNLKKLRQALFEKDAVKRERLVLEMTTRLSPDKIAELSETWAAYSGEFPALKRNILAQLWAASRFRLGAPPPVDTLVLASRQDGLVNPKCSETLSVKTGFPIQWHPEAGHDLTLEDPAWASRSIVSWSNSL
ncbi:MAG: alpha/beta hydrolase [Bdellovibrionia bacterium]